MSDNKNKDDTMDTTYTSSLDLNNPVIAHGVMAARILGLTDYEMISFFLKVDVAMSMLEDKNLTIEKALMNIAEHRADPRKSLSRERAYQVVAEIYYTPIKKMIDL